MSTIPSEAEPVVTLVLAGTYRSFTKWCDTTGVSHHDPAYVYVGGPGDLHGRGKVKLVTLDDFRFGSREAAGIYDALLVLRRMGQVVEDEARTD